LWATQAQAQTGAAAAAAPAPQGNSADVLVVANKREASVEKVPVAVTAFSAKERDIIGIKSINDMAEYTPGLSYFNGDDRAFIRGIGRQTDLLTVSPAVAIYKDGVYAGGNGSIALQQDTLFIDRIEVDRGPQSTLFGRNSDGGAINYIFRRPTKTWQEEVRGGIGDYDKYYAEALVSGPLNDNVRVLVGGNYFQENGGYWKNLIGHPQGGDISQGGNGTSHYLEAQFDANFGNFDWWGKASTGGYLTSWYQGPVLGPVNDTEFPAGIATGEPSAFFGLCALPGNTGLGCSIPLSPDHIVPGSVQTASATSIVNVNNAGNHRTFIGAQPNTTSVRNDFQVSTTLTWHGPGVDLKYIGGYESFLYVGLFSDQSGSTSGVNSFQVAGVDPTIPIVGPARLANCQAKFPLTPGLCTAPLTISPTPGFTTFIEDEQFFSHELAFSSTYQGPLQFLGGLYWYHDHFDQPIDVNNYPNQRQLLNPVFLPTLAPAPVTTDAATAHTDRGASADSYAAYGQLDWKATDSVKFTVGLRYTEDQIRGFVRERFISFDNPSLGVTANTFGANTPALDVTSIFDAGPCGAIAANHPKGAGNCVLNTTTGFAQVNLRANFNAVTGTAGVEWTPDSHTLAYAKYSRGYKTGAFDTPTIVAVPETAPEFVDSYEAGLKLSHPTWQINGDVFYYNYTNDQQPLSVQIPVGAGFQTVGELFPIPAVHTWGVELEAVWHPIEPLVINAQYSYLSAKIASTGGQCLLDTTDPLALDPRANTNCSLLAEDASAGLPPGTPRSAFPPNASLVQNVVGNSLPQAPANKYSVNATYTWQFEPGSLALTGSLSWRDKAYGTIFNRTYNTIPAFTLVNLRAVYNDAKNRFTVIGFWNNVFNQTWSDNVSGALLNSGGPTQIHGPGTEIINQAFTYGAPSTVGLEVQVRWR
ncbi:MAG TPA: TonB-dependent receptor, partial [Caulobacteraceae bacterium]|nr:TonB-dependent receptor [Caulobacteraceae bacterium]